jgi:hypothetical protein
MEKVEIVNSFIKRQIMDKSVTRHKIIIFSAGKPPIGSWHQRIKMFDIGFKDSLIKNVSFALITLYSN